MSISHAHRKQLSDQTIDKSRVKRQRGCLAFGDNMPEQPVFAGIGQKVLYRPGQQLDRFTRLLSDTDIKV